MSVLPPRAAVESERPEPPVTALPTAPSPPADTSFPRRPGAERIVLGLSLAAAGTAWLLDEIVAPAAVVVLGVALLVTGVVDSRLHGQKSSKEVREVST